VIRYNDLLLNGTGVGTIGRCAPYLEPYESLPDNHVTILRVEGVDPVFLSIFVNGILGQLQVEMHQRGSSGQIELYPFDIRKFLVWIPSAELQQEIRDRYNKSIDSERASREYLRQATSLADLFSLR
jgi:type I restriction enzyme M protein